MYIMNVFLTSFITFIYNISQCIHSPRGSYTKLKTCSTFRQSKYHSRAVENCCLPIFIAVAGSPIIHLHVQPNDAANLLTCDDSVLIPFHWKYPQYPPKKSKLEKHPCKNTMTTKHLLKGVWSETHYLSR